VDELVLLSIDGTPPDVALVSDVASEIFAPLAVGGGITSLCEIGALINRGADKVVINSGAVARPALITEAARKYGSQAITVAIDVGELGEIYIDSGKTCVMDKYSTGWAKRVEDLGAGEILLTSIPRDGTMSGMDLELIESVSSSVSIPVVACGGAGTPEHFLQALQAGAHAVAAGAIFSFTDVVPNDVAKYLASRGVPVRLKTRVA
jgi:cyclase